MNERRDELRRSRTLSTSSPSDPNHPVRISLSTHTYATEAIQHLRAAATLLAHRPDQSGVYNLRLYPLSLERAALLAMLAGEERHAKGAVHAAYEEEQARVEQEWKRGRERVRDRLLEGIEQRRRRAREEKDGDGTVGMLRLRSVWPS